MITGAVLNSLKSTELCGKNININYITFLVRYVVISNLDSPEWPESRHVLFHCMKWLLINGRLRNRLDFESNDNKSQRINNLILSFLDRPSSICVKWNCQLHSGEPELSWSGHIKSNTCHLGRLCTQKRKVIMQHDLSQRDRRTLRHEPGLFFLRGRTVSVYWINF